MATNSRIRSIKPDFWEDEQVAKLPLPANLLFIGMWNYADDSGVIRANPQWIKTRVFPLREDVVRQDVADWLEVLIAENFLIPFTYGGNDYLLIRTFRIHQRIDRPGKSEVPDSVLNELLGVESRTKKGIRRIFDEDSTNTRRLFDDDSTNVRRTLDDDSSTGVGVGEGVGVGKGKEEEEGTELFGEDASAPPHHLRQKSSSRFRSTPDASSRSLASRSPSGPSSTRRSMSNNRSANAEGGALPTRASARPKREY